MFILFPRFFGWQDQGLAFDALVHLGTFCALLWYYRKELKKLLIDVLHKKKEAIDFVLRVGVATLPALFIALLVKDLIERYLRSAWVVMISLIVWGIVLFIADRRSGRKKVHLDDYQKISWNQALLIGFAQPIALIPGTSRSGITITAGLFAGLNRRAAAQFAFFLAMPLTGLAGIYGLWKSLSEQSTYSMSAHIIGFLSATAFGLLAIHFLLAYVKKRRYDIFTYYRIALAVIIGIFLIGS